MSSIIAKRLQGIAASPGIAIARAYRLSRRTEAPTRRTVADREAEAARLREALSLAKQEVEAIRELTEARLGAQKAGIFEAHAQLLEDPDLIDVVFEQIAGTGVNAEFALHEVAGTFIEALLAMDNELLRERAADVRDVTGRVIGLLTGEKQTSLSELTEEAIVIAEDLTPSDTALLDVNLVRGFVTEVGSRTSHSAIMARSLGLPAIVGAGSGAGDIAPGALVVLDAVEGLVVVEPGEAELAACREKKRQYDARKAELSRLRDQPSMTSDGHRVELAANIGGVEDVNKALEQGVEGIGLFRTEFLYMGRSALPTEEEQFTVYKYVLEKMSGKPVVIRTLDIGGDKELPYLKLPEESNPFLGLRAVRLCLTREELFRTQLRALLRASAYGQLKIMFPMIAVVQELREAKRLLAEERAKLKEAGEAVADNIEVGIMIEVPAAALAADRLAREADFFSIGTNDLIQYTMAADRMNETVSYLYQPCHPAILRLVDMVIRAAEREGRWVGMCGEMAGDETAIPLLLGLGLHEFSMSAGSVLPARALLRGLSRAEWAGHARQALEMESEEEVKAYVNHMVKGVE